jgi:hypothetical protein
MKLFGFGIFDHIQAQVDPTHNALRVSLRPAEKGVNGAYKIALVSGIMAAGLAAGSPIVACRWSARNVNALIRYVRLTAGTDGTAFAQGSTIFDMIRATGFTVQDTGGAVISLAGKSQALSTRFGPSQVQIAASATGDIAIANTATLVAGTRTLDSNAMAALVGSVGAVPANFPVMPPGPLWQPSEAGLEPLELTLNEGFIIRATVPITGTWKFAFEMAYDEIDPARFFKP